MEKLINYIKGFKDKSKESVLTSLRTINDLTNEEKNLIYFYLFPRPLLDKELVSRFVQLRGDINKAGKLDPDLNESTLIIEAGQTAQYSRFIKHLCYSFSNPSNIFPIEGSNITTCCLCGKEIYELTLWNCFSKQYGQKEIDEKLYLAYGSIESNVSVCLPCLINLKKAIDIINVLDPTYLVDFNNQNSDTKASSPY